MSIVNVNSTSFEVGITSKITLAATVDSPDPATTYEWTVDSRTDLMLVRGESTATSSTLGEHLVIKPNILAGGETYAFKLTVTNSHGAEGFGVLNVTASRPPWILSHQRLALH